MSTPSQRYTLTRENVREALERLLVFVAGMAGIKSGVVGLDQLAEMVGPLREAVSHNPDTSTFIAAVVAIFGREFCRGGQPSSVDSSKQPPVSPGV